LTINFHFVILCLRFYLAGKFFAQSVTSEYD
jgi:hypothetical protein